MSLEYSEDKLVQEMTADYLANNLGWKNVYAYDKEDYGPDSLLGRVNQTEVVLTRYLRKALEKYNHSLPEEIYKNAIEQITSYSISKSLLQMNEDMYKLFKEGVKVPFRNERGQQDSVTLKVFNFTDPVDNDFLAVREMWIQGNIYRRRPDIIGFVNGMRQ